LHAFLARHAAGRLHGADEGDRGGRHDFWRSIRGPAGLRNPLPEGDVPLDSGHVQHPGRDHHPVCRRSLGQDRSQAADHRRRRSVPASLTVCRRRRSATASPARRQLSAAAPSARRS
jgi:hypothetical protein